MDESRIPHWRVLKKKELAKNRFITLNEEICQEPESGKEGSFYVIEALDWVNIIAITKEKELVLVEQYRYGIHANAYEIPGGVVDPGENPAIAIMRELEEETGYVASPTSEFRQIGVVNPNPALMSNKCYTY
jgi:ADP-ribose pyrophosphatase